MTLQKLQQAIGQGSVVLDIRAEDAYNAAHVPGALAAPFETPGWGPAIQDWLSRNAPDRPVLIFGDTPELTRTACRTLDGPELTVLSWDQGMEPWQAAGLPVVSIPSITVDALQCELDRWTVIDVREPYECRTGIIPQARMMPLSELPRRLHELSRDERYTIVCAHGNRSQSVTAYLAEQGYQVSNVLGGMALWHAGGHPVVLPERPI